MGELELRNRLFREAHARDCQEIEELRRICWEETDRARQARVDELSLHQNRGPTTVSQLLTQIQELQKVNSLSDAREFYDPETSSAGASHVLSPLTIPSPGTVPCRDSCRMIHGMLWVIQETFLNDYLLEFRKFKEFGIFSRIET